MSPSITPGTHWPPASSTTFPGNNSSKTLPPVTSFVKPSSKASSDVRRTPQHLFRGPAVEVVVGSNPGPLSPSTSSHTWWPSIALISHYSVTLLNACNRERDQAEPPRITLPENDPRIFELFYNWMLYGTYNISEPTDLFATNPEVSPDSQAWVLGETLQSTEFKNYAMNRLYDQYATNFAPKPITPAEVRYVFTHTAANSKLRQIFLDLFAIHSRSSLRVLGGFKEWDEVMQNHQELRESFFTHSRFIVIADVSSTVLHKKTYMEVEKAAPSKEASVKVVEQVVGVKRNAHGAVVKNEPKDA